jgi:hypothetical protein
MIFFCLIWRKGCIWPIRTSINTEFVQCRPLRSLGDKTCRWIDLTMHSSYSVTAKIQQKRHIKPRARESHQPWPQHTNRVMFQDKFASCKESSPSYSVLDCRPGNICSWFMTFLIPFERPPDNTTDWLRPLKGKGRYVPCAQLIKRHAMNTYTGMNV